MLPVLAHGEESVWEQRNEDAAAVPPAETVGTGPEEGTGPGEGTADAPVSGEARAEEGGDAGPEDTPRATGTEERMATGSVLQVPADAKDPPSSPDDSDPETIPAPPPRVCIHELQWMGTDLSTADEWIELAAVGSGAARVSLAGWAIVSVVDGVEKPMITFATGHDIGPGEFRIVSNYAAFQSRLLEEPMLVTTSVSLPNTKLLLRLRDASGALIDEVDDGVGAPFAGANPSGASKAAMERIDCLAPGTDPANWATATVALGIDADAPVLGTPGHPNSVARPADPGGDAGSSSGSGISLEPFYKPIISEVLPDPPGADTAEWIELFNPTGTGIDLAGWALRRGTTVYRFPPGTGALLGSGHTVVLLPSVTKLTLPNAGGTVELLFGEQRMDQLTYPALPEGVSFGWVAGETEPRSFCLPTPGQPNVSLMPQLSLEGVRDGETVSTVNLDVRALSGSIKGGQCNWNFGDGYLYAGCNPPAHAMRTSGTVSITVTVRDYCGNTMIQSVRVTAEAKKGTAAKEKEQKPACTPTAFSGVTLTEFLPDPLGDETAGEWIEVFNPTQEPVDFCGWSIDDEQGGSKPYGLDGRLLLPQEYLLLPRKETKIALNNDKDTVRLIAPLPEGGTGVLVEVGYARSIEGESFALREDGEWLWTNRATPGAANLFRAADPWPGALPVIISAALPDPEGKDEGQEWVELQNVTDRPQWLLGNWQLRTADGKKRALHGTGFPPRATVRIPIDNPGMTLRNTDGAVLLVDPAEQVRSVLAWGKTKAGHPIVRAASPLCTLTHVSYQGEGMLRGRLHGERPAKTFRLSALTLPAETEVYPAVSSQREQFLSSLLQDKKVELECDAIGADDPRLFVDGVEVLPLLLRLGFAHVPGKEAVRGRAEYLVYEAEAQKEKRGIWKNALTAQQIDAFKETERLRDIVEREGVRLTIGPQPGLVEAGALIELQTNVPAIIYRETLAGEWEPFIGGAVTRDDTMRFRAEFREGDRVVLSEVLERSYILRRERYPRCLTVTEIYPSPNKDETEWVELYNQCDQSIPLAGWLIDDEYPKGSKPVTLGIDQAVPPRSHRALTGSVIGKIAFNNSGDSVLLRSPDGRIAAAVTFPSVKKGWSYALVGEQYCLTQRPTPGAPNECFIAPKPPPKKKKAAAPRKIILGVATKYVVGLQSVAGAPVTPSPLRAQLAGQLGGGAGGVLSEAPESGIGWQILLASLLLLLVVGAGWGAYGIRNR